MVDTVKLEYYHFRIEELEQELLYLRTLKDDLVPCIDNKTKHEIYAVNIENIKNKINAMKMYLEINRG